MSEIEPVELLRRQYLQLLDPKELTFPKPNILRLPDTQQKIYDKIFKEQAVSFEPPLRYQYRVLKRAVYEIENAILDPDEDEISNDVLDRLAQFMGMSIPPDTAAAQQKCYVTYTAPLLSPSGPSITLFEAPSLLASAGTTGFRTWEAALHLATYLCLNPSRHPVSNKNVIELGAGTGLLSILCAKYLGAASIMATDGSLEVIKDLEANVELNNLGGSSNIDTAVLPWGHSLLGRFAEYHREKGSFQLAIGADITYDTATIPALIATLRELFELHPGVEILISATVRNEATVVAFLQSCKASKFDVKDIVPEVQPSKQIGFFHNTSTAIKLFDIRKVGQVRDPFSVQ